MPKFVFLAKFLGEDIIQNLTLKVYENARA